MIGISTLHFAIRLLLAIAMGATVGLERQWRQRMAGLRPEALPAALRSEIRRIGQIACETIGLRGYGSLDVRIDRFGRVTVIEVNANPGLSGDSPVWGRRRFDLTLRQIVNAVL